MDAEDSDFVRCHSLIFYLRLSVWKVGSYPSMYEISQHNEDTFG